MPPSRRLGKSTHAQNGQPGSAPYAVRQGMPGQRRARRNSGGTAPGIADDAWTTWRAGRVALGWAVAAMASGSGSRAARRRDRSSRPAATSVRAPRDHRVAEIEIGQPAMAAGVEYRQTAEEHRQDRRRGKIPSARSWIRSRAAPGRSPCREPAARPFRVLPPRKSHEFPILGYAAGRRAFPALAGPGYRQENVQAAGEIASDPGRRRPADRQTGMGGRGPW